jgi:hypothetical protein
MVRVVGQWSGHILLCASGGNLTRAHFHRRCLAAADCPSPRSLAAAHAALGAWLRASHPASGRAGMRRVGGRRRSSVSDRANASVVPAGEVTDEQAARQVSGGVAAGACDRPHALRPIGPSPSVPRGRTCTARIAPTCTVLPPYAREVGLSSYFVTAFGLHRAACARPGLCISRVPPAHPRLSRLSRGRACTSRIARTCIARLPPSAVRPAAAQLL